MNRRFTIGLFGIQGLYNFGCEAIVRGTYRLIREAWPNSSIVLYTYCPREDSAILKDLDIVCKEVPIRRFKLLRRIVNKLLRTVSSGIRLPIWDAKAVAEECNVVFSIGGDIYTIPRFILDQGKEQAYSAIVEFGKTLVKYRPLVIWGASIGPFGNKDEVKEYYFSHLSDVHRIYCREEMTYRYLEKHIDTSKVLVMPDPAFYVKGEFGVRGETDKNRSKIRIALNLSPLSLNEYGGSNNDFLEGQVMKGVRDLLTIPNIELVLVPHVVSPFSEKDNDLAFLRSVYNNLSDLRTKEASVSILEDCNGFINTKRFLKTCDIVIAARMHCAINAITEGIPTIFITYSLKGLGMADYVYGSSRWIISIDDIGEKLKDAALELLSCKKTVAEQIKKRLKEIEREETRVVESLSELSP